MAGKGIELVQNPKDQDYEDYISAYLQAGGLYVEKSIIYRGKAELLELDIITTNFEKANTRKYLIEIKSGHWGFNEIFKVKGWLVYLKMNEGVFIIKEKRDHLAYFQDKAKELGITLIDNSDLSQTEVNLKEYIIQSTSEDEIESIRFSYLLERKLVKHIKVLKKRYPEKECYKRLDDYLFKINSGSFFSNNPVRRIKQLFDAYIENKNITAKICHEIETGEYDEEVTDLEQKCFKQLFYQCENNILQVSLYVEHMARVTILKSCIEHLITKHQKDFGAKDFKERLEYLSLPGTIQGGLSEIVLEPFFYRYPVFWQFFTYVMGGFILLDFKDAEYEYISKHTGIPIEEIPNAFDSYNKLFPKEDGWMHGLPYSNILMHRFFPVPFSGVGANHRRFMYLDKAKGKQEYEELGKMLTGNNTLKDLIKWNNLGYDILK